MRQILFVCTGNTCRSSMAEGICKNLLAAEGVADVDVVSAGIYALTGAPASPEAVEALAEWGIDLSGHKARLLTPETVKDVDLVLTMASHHKKAVLEMAPEEKEKVFTLTEYAGFAGDIPDPIGKPLFFYRQYAEEIRRLCRLAMARFLAGEEKN
ncbi:MAG: low molecular weight protein arginine phosphatase [Ammonifex sp.]|nr:MAG: low molecular weight protein arginine phosphatase [Ammonifex sp.]